MVAEEGRPRKDGEAPSAAVVVELREEREVAGEVGVGLGIVLGLLEAKDLQAKVPKRLEEALLPSRCFERVAV